MEKDQTIDELFSTMRPLLVGECLRSLGSTQYQRQNIDDLLQDVYCIALESREKLLTSPNPQGWLMLCCRNVCLNARRKKMRHVRLIGHQIELRDENLPADDVITAWMQHDAVQSVIRELKKQLNEREQVIFHEYFELNNSVRQVSEAHGITESAAKSVIHRIRQKALKLSPMVTLALILSHIMK